MYCLKFRDSQRSHDLLLFNTYEEAVNFIQAFPFLKSEHYEFEDLKFDDYYFYAKDLPDYFEWEYGGKVIPMTKFSFMDARIDFEICEIDHFESMGNRIVDGTTKVDAWMVNNQDLKAYVLNREALANELMKQLKDLSYTNIERSYYGSEDGEAIRAKKGDDLTFFSHLDPLLVDGYLKSSKSLEDYVEQEINANL